jgi:TatD DNase family protein
MPQALALAQRYPDILSASVGMHPDRAQDLPFYTDTAQSVVHTDFLSIERYIQDYPQHIVAVGETGLDYFHISTDPDISIIQQKNQEIWFREQYMLAKKYNLPLIVHSRDAADDTLACIRRYGMSDIILHCYSYDEVYAQKFLDACPGIYFSFSGNVTYKSATDIARAAAYIPLDRLLIETDSPFLAPVPVRGTANEPANVRYVLDHIATLRTESRDILEQATYANACRVYGVE